MMRLLVALLVTVLVPASLVRAQDGDSDVKPGKTVGSGYEHLRFPSDPDERGLIWNIPEPLRVGDRWAVSVLNASDEIVSGLCATIEYHVDGEWYLSATRNHSMWPVPYEIEPGEYSIAVGEGLRQGASDWDDVRLAPCEADDAPSSSEVLDLRIRDFTFRRGEMTGEVVNDTDQSVRNITVYLRCVDSDGVIYEGTFDVLDIRTLDPGDTEPFDYDDAEQCERAADVVGSALAIIRDT